MWVVKFVCHKGTSAFCFAFFTIDHNVHKIFTGTFDPPGNHYKCNYVFRQMFHLSEHVHCIDKYVDTFIFVFVASADTNHQCIFVNGVPQSLFGYIFQYFPCTLDTCFMSVAFWDESFFESVGCYHFGMTMEELCTLLRSDITHSGEAVNIHCCALFNGVFCLHSKLTSHLVAVVVFKIVVEWQSVAGNGATHASGMSGEYGCYLWNKLLYIECSHSHLPFVEVGNHIL